MGNKVENINSLHYNIFYTLLKYILFPTTIGFILKLIQKVQYYLVDRTVHLLYCTYNRLKG